MSLSLSISLSLSLYLNNIFGSSIYIKVFIVYAYGSYNHYLNETPRIYIKIYLGFHVSLSRLRHLHHLKLKFVPVNSH